MPVCTISHISLHCTTPDFMLSRQTGATCCISPHSGSTLTANRLQVGPAARCLRQAFHPPLLPAMSTAPWYTAGTHQLTGWCVQADWCHKQTA